MAAGMAAQSVSALADDERAAPLGQTVLPPIDYQGASYFSAPKPKKKSLDEVDPELLKIYDKLGIPLDERKALLGVEEQGHMPSLSMRCSTRCP